MLTALLTSELDKKQKISQIKVWKNKLNPQIIYYIKTSHTHINTCLREDSIARLERLEIKRVIITEL